MLLALSLLAGCGGSGSNEDPAPAVSTSERAGESVGVADAIDRTRAVADRAEDRLETIDQLAP